MTPQLTPQPAVATLRQCPIPALRELSVEENDDEVVIHGCVSSWYHKQLAQELLLPHLGDRRLYNCVHVVRPVLVQQDDF